MSNIGGTQDEQERLWNAVNAGGAGPATTMPGGHVILSRPKERPEWEMPLVPALPKRPPIALIAPQKAAREVQLVEKICVLGDSGVGKTSLVRRYAHKSFDAEYLTTCGAKVTQRRINLDYPGQNLLARLSVQIWDVTGECRGRLNPAFFRGASGALVVGDAVRLETQLDIWKWIEAFRNVAGDVPVVIVINKTDIMDRQEFDYLLMDELSGEYGCGYVLTSARTNFKVDKAFRELCDRLVKRSLCMD